MRTHQRPLVVCALVAASALGGCTTPEGLGEPERGELGVADDSLTLDFCPTTSADRIVQLGSSGGGPVYVKSGSGFYGYRACPFFQVDFQVSSTSRKLFVEDPSSWDSWDLPSSKAYGGTIPTNSEDCARYTLRMRLYDRLQGATSWTLRGTRTLAGVWKDGACGLVTKAQTGTLDREMKPPASGFDFYRLAVSAKLRSSFQEATVGVRQQVY